MANTIKNIGASFVKFISCSLVYILIGMWIFSMDWYVMTLSVAAFLYNISLISGVVYFVAKFNLMPAWKAFVFAICLFVYMFTVRSYIKVIEINDCSEYARWNEELGICEEPQDE